MLWFGGSLTFAGSSSFKRFCSHILPNHKTDLKFMKFKNKYIKRRRFYYYFGISAIGYTIFKVYSMTMGASDTVKINK